METASTFLKLSSSEAILDEWEVLDVPRKIMFGDIVLIVIGVFMFFRPGIPIFYVFLAMEVFPPRAFYYIIQAIGLLIAGCTAFNALTRHHRVGHLCLTNWRLLYYERGTAWSRSFHFVRTTDLADIVGVQTVYHRRLLGEVQVFIRIYTEHDHDFWIKIGESGGLLTKIPGLRWLFWRRSIGKDTYQVPPQLYCLIKERQGQLAEASSRY